MSKVVVQADPEPLSGYNNRAFEWMLHEEFNKLKARLLNLAETTATSKEQAEAMKGLIKDFTNQAYYGSLRQISNFLVYFKVLDKEESDSPIGPMLEANSLKDILV